MEETAREIVTMALHFLLDAGVSVWLVAIFAVGMALLWVMVPQVYRGAADAVKRIKVGPQQVSDENGPQVEGGTDFGDPDRPGGGESYGG
jgi:hypothetical protein